MMFASGSVVQDEARPMLGHSDHIHIEYRTQVVEREWLMLSG